MPPGPTNPAPERADLIDRLARGLGFAQVGFASPRISPYSGAFIQWIASGAHGQMAYMAQSPEVRLDPSRLLPGAQTIICVVDLYPAKPTTPQEPGPVDAGAGALGKIARYAWGDDYHRNLKDRLHALADILRERFPDERFLTTVDSAPILEREQAAGAGLGWVGKHTLLIHPRNGSWMVLGEILTTLKVQTAQDLGIAPDNHCGGCTRCIDACPTECITPYSVNGSECISYLTIEHKGPIPEHLHPKMGQWIAGCDVCQEVCPFNRPTAGLEHDGVNRPTQPADGKEPSRLDKRYSAGDIGFDPEHPYHHGYATRAPGPAIGLLRVLQWTPKEREEMLRRSALKRIKLEMFQRNALIAAGNFVEGNPDHPESAALLAEITSLAQAHADPTVKTTARQTLKRLTKS